jgi:acyl dehydratase
MLTTSLAKLASHEGEDLGFSSWVKIEQSQIDQFAATTFDDQWIHVDPSRAANGPFGTTVAHGYLTLSLGSWFLLELLQVSGASTAINYGLDRVRFPSPVPVKSELRGHGKLMRVFEVAGGFQTTTRLTITSRSGNKPAAVADVLTRFMY